MNEELLKVLLAALGGAALPAPAPAPAAPPAQPETPPLDLGKLLALVLPLLLPLLIQALQRALTPGAAAAALPVSGLPVPSVPIPTNPDPNWAPARGVLELRWIVHERGDRIYYPGQTKTLAGQVVGDGTEFFRRLQGVVPINKHSKLAITPTFFAADGRELDSRDWDALGWTDNIKYWVRFDPDPDNEQSVAALVESAFLANSQAKEMTIEPNRGIANSGQGAIGRNGRSIAINLQAEGLCTLWAEMPDGRKTDPLRFTVR